jgi:hypothetical protein
MRKLAVPGVIVLVMLLSLGAVMGADCDLVCVFINDCGFTG